VGRGNGAGNLKDGMGYLPLSAPFLPVGCIHCSDSQQGRQDSLALGEL
jgi:hypothetical protein